MGCNERQGMKTNGLGKHVVNSGAERRTGLC
jgi:hypothetical protein